MDKNLDPVKGLIFDIDGVLTFQGTTLPGAIDTIDQLRTRGMSLRFFTNSTLKSRRSCTARLADQGFKVSETEVLTASYATAVYLRNLKPRSIFLMLEREGVEEFSGFSRDPQNPEYVVVGDNRSNFDFAHLNQAIRLLRGGAKLIGMTPEILDTSSGELELNVGSWVRLLELASGVRAVYVGKPCQFAFELTLTSMGLEKSQVAMIGDRINTDILGAKESSIRSILVKTGEFEPDDLKNPIQPDFVIDSISDLLSLLTRE